MGSNPIVASTMSTFQWRETLKAIRPPLFTRLGCVGVSVLIFAQMVALIVGGLLIIKYFYISLDDQQTQEGLSTLMGMLVFYSPIGAIIVAIIAFFESVDFLVWLKLPLYPPPPAPKPDPLEAFKSSKG